MEAFWWDRLTEGKTESCSDRRGSAQFSSVQFSCSVVSDSLEFPMNSSIPDLPVHHQLLEFTQTHVHRLSDAIQPSHPLSSSSPPAPNPSQHQGLFQWISSSNHVPKLVEFQPHHQSFQRIFTTDFLLGLTNLISMKSKRLTRVFSNTTVQKHQLFGAQLSLFFNSHIHIWILKKKNSFDYTHLFQLSDISDF